MAEYVVHRYEENYPDDSYFYAVVFNTETKESHEVIEWSTAFGGVNPDLPEDATAEIRETWSRHERAVSLVKFRRMYKALAEDMHLPHYTYARKLHTSLSANLLITVRLSVRSWHSRYVNGALKLKTSTAPRLVRNSLPALHRNVSTVRTLSIPNTSKNKSPSN